MHLARMEVKGVVTLGRLLSRYGIAVRGLTVASTFLSISTGRFDSAPNVENRTKYVAIEPSSG